MFIYVAFCLQIGMAQHSVSLRLAKANLQTPGTCYNLSMRNEQNEDIILAGQNYRLFYDANILRFLPGVVSSLNPESYGDPEVVHMEKNELGFISISTDAIQRNDYALNLRPQKWQQIIQICFSGNSIKSEDLIWADPQKTSSIASAEIVVSEWEFSGRQSVLNIQELISEDANDLSELRTQSSFEFYPNPVSGQASYQFESLDDPEQIVIKDVLGRNLSTTDINPGSKVGKLEFSSFPSGTYYLQTRKHGTLQVIKSK